MPTPQRGEIYELVNTSGLVLVVSTDQFNQLPYDRVFVLSLTDRRFDQPFHVEIEPSFASPFSESRWVVSESLRFVKRTDLGNGLGPVAPDVLQRVEQCLRTMLELIETPKWLQDADT